jgi:4-hydroxybenzoate polyprenyltransferase
MPGSSRLGAFTRLARVSNLPTVWSNVLAGTAAGSAIDGWSAVDGPTLAVTLLSASAFYTGGMFLNDAFDEPYDRSARPERPIPRGDVTRREAFTVGGALLAFGVLMIAPGAQAMLLGAALAGAIVFYDARHKGQPFAPLVMGACRGLVYLIAATMAGAIGRAAAAGALMMVAYVAGLTVVARRAGADARWLVPALIAGISLVDALFIAVVRPAAISIAWVAALGFPLTLVLQRWVPGD